MDAAYFRRITDELRFNRLADVRHAWETIDSAADVFRAERAMDYAFASGCSTRDVDAAKREGIVRNPRRERVPDIIRDAHAFRER